MPWSKLALVEKKTYGYRERDEVERAAFQQRLENTLPSQRVYIDEAGIDNRDDYGYGYSEIGERFYPLKSGKRTERISWIAALKEGKLFAPLTFEGTCNRDLFEMWLAKGLIPQLSPGDIILIVLTFFRSAIPAGANALPLGLRQ
jgi:hypothetical protein